MPDRIVDVDTILVDGKPYRMVRTTDARAWQREFYDEPPWAGGLPNVLSVPLQSWHSGGFRSRAGYAPVSEYGQNTDCRFPYRIFPAPKIHTLELPGSLSTPRSMFEALSHLWVITGRHVFRVDNVDNVTLSKDFGGSVKAIKGLKWEGDFGLVTTDAATRSLWKVTDTSDPDTWNQTNDVSAYRLSVGVDRLYKVTKEGFLKNVSTGLDPMNDSNYADNIQCGKTASPPTGLVSYARTVFVGKPEALYGIDETGVARPLVSRMIEDDENCLGLAPVDPWVYVPHARGLYRIVPGAVFSVGLEQEVMNESPVRGRVRAITTDGKWVLVSLWTGTDTYILTGRDAEEEDEALGPMVWDTLLYLPGAACDVLWVSSLTDPPRLWFGNGNNLGYVKLTTGAGAPDPLGAGYLFSTSGTRYFPRHNFNDWGNKSFSKIVAVGRNATSDRYWIVSYSIDGGAFSSLDADGAQMRINSEGRLTFILPEGAVGREIQLRVSYVGNSDSESSEIVYLEPFAVPQSRKLPVVVTQLYLAPGIQDHNDEVRIGLDQMADLQALVEQASPVSISAPWGTGQSWIRKLRIVEVVQEGDRPPELLAELTLQERET